MNAQPDRLPRPHRMLLAVGALLVMVLLAMARNLEPDPRGYGTHEQLGFTPCYFHERTGLLCPMCGGTTAWAHTVRGQFARAATVNLGAALLCVVAVVSSPWLLIVATWGRWPVFKPTLTLILLMASVWLAVVVLDWLRRIYLGM